MINFIVLAFGISLLWVGNWNQLSQGYYDVKIYQCFANDFWFGKGCNLVGHPQDGVPFKILPTEYPPLSLLIFSLPLLFPTLPYHISFGVLMTVLIIITYYYLTKFGEKESAISFMIFLILGAYSLAISRFDIVPSTLTFFVLILAQKRRFVLSYLFLALATMLKLYPIFLFLPLFIYQQQIIRKTKRLTRLKGLTVFLLTCLTVVSISIFLNPDRVDTYISHYLNRPFEVESVPASVLAIVAKAESLCVSTSFGSINLYEKIDMSCLNSVGQTYTFLMWIFLTLQLTFILWIAFWQWKARPALTSVFILTLLSVLITNKIFSPQFIIWIIPFIAYEKVSLFRLVYWGVVLALTTYIFTFNFTPINNPQNPFYLPTFLFFTTLRNSLLIFAWMFYLYRMINPLTAKSPAANSG